MATAPRQSAKKLASIVGGGTALAAITLGPTYAFLSQYKPELLPEPVASYACGDLDELDDRRRCTCLKALFRQGRIANSLKERLGHLDPYARACWNQADPQPGLDARHTSMLLQVELARAVLEPSSLCTSRIEALVRSGAHLQAALPPHPYYPAIASAEEQFLVWVMGTMRGEATAELAAVRAAVDTNPAYARLRDILKTSAAADQCMKEWKQARASGDWHAAHTVCLRASSSLPKDLLAQLEADSPLPIPASRASAGLAEGGEPDKPVVSGCTGKKGVLSLVMDGPKPDGLTYGNLAAVAATESEFKALLTQSSRSFLPGHLPWLELLTPVKTPAEREQYAQQLGAAELRLMLDFLRRPVQLIGRTKAIGDRNSGLADGRLPRLPARMLKDALCALTGPGWPAEFIAERFESQAPTLLRLQLARDMLSLEKGTPTRDLRRCATLTMLGLLRSPDQEEQSKARQAFETHSKALRSDAEYGQTVEDLRCQVAAEFETEREADSSINSLIERDAKYATPCATRTFLFRYSRKQFDAAKDALQIVRNGGQDELANTLEKLLPREDGAIEKPAILEVLKELRIKLPGEGYKTALLALEGSLA